MIPPQQQQSPLHDLRSYDHFSIRLLRFTSRRAERSISPSISSGGPFVPTLFSNLAYSSRGEGTGFTAGLRKLVPNESVSLAFGFSGMSEISNCKQSERASEHERSVGRSGSKARHAQAGGMGPALSERASGDRYVLRWDQQHRLGLERAGRGGNAQRGICLDLISFIAGTGPPSWSQGRGGV